MKHENTWPVLDTKDKVAVRQTIRIIQERMSGWLAASQDPKQGTILQQHWATLYRGGQLILDVVTQMSEPS